jgi:hypothetical protein
MTPPFWVKTTGGSMKGKDGRLFYSAHNPKASRAPLGCAGRGRPQPRSSMLFAVVCSRFVPSVPNLFPLCKGPGIPSVQLGLSLYTHFVKKLSKNWTRHEQESVSMGRTIDSKSENSKQNSASRPARAWSSTSPAPANTPITFKIVNDSSK